MDASRLRVSPPRYEIDGREVTRKDVLERLSKDRLVDDSKKLRLTAFGPPELGETVRKGLGEWSGKVLYQHYLADHRIVKNGGFDVTGGRAIYLQSPDGAELKRWPDYPGDARFAQDLREATDPKKPKPTPPLPEPPNPPGDCTWMWWAGLAAGAGGVMWLLNRVQGRDNVR